MMKKNIGKIFAFFLMLGIGIDTCNAVGLRFNSQLIQSGNSGSTGNSEVPYTDWKYHQIGGKTYRYRYKKSLSTTTDIVMNAYNLEGESVIPASTQIDKNKYTFKAGTWIGINVTESHTATWKVYDLQYEEAKTQTTCKYYDYVYRRVYASTSYTESQCKSLYHWPSGYRKWHNYDPTTNTCYIRQYEKEPASYNEIKNYGVVADCKPSYFEGGINYEYDDGKTTSTVYQKITNGTAVDAMKKLAVKEVYEAAKSSVNWSSGIVKYITNNDYPDNLKKLNYNTINQGTSGLYQEDPDITDLSGWVYKEYEILEKKVCMNAKKATVTYGEDCNADEIQIKNGTIYDKYLGTNVNFWHYFIPLNAKSNSEFSLDVVKNENKKFSVDECLSFMTSAENKDNYKDFITPISQNDEDAFVGDYNNYQTDDARKKYSADYKKLTSGGGCNISTKIYFPIEQSFYNEVTNSKTDEISFNGFNFYYKPIDVDGATKDNQTSIIFPNGVSTDKNKKITTTTLWDDWYNAQTNKSASTEDKSPDLTQSYSVQTYVANNIKLGQIRNYNANNAYTSWSNMNLNGTSKFIDNEGMIFRVKPGEVYKLGCGPANSDPKSILYIKGCELS